MTGLHWIAVMSQERGGPLAGLHCCICCTGAVPLERQQWHDGSSFSCKDGSPCCPLLRLGCCLLLGASGVAAPSPFPAPAPGLCLACSAFFSIAISISRSWTVLFSAQQNWWCCDHGHMSLAMALATCSSRCTADAQQMHSRCTAFCSSPPPEALVSECKPEHFPLHSYCTHHIVTVPTT